jgi:hypothetical protein
MPDTIVASRDTMAIPGEGYLDVPRTRVLWDSVFLATKSIARRRDWVDQPSVGIPYLYVSGGAILAEALQRHGEPQAAQKVMSQVRAIAKATRLDDLLRGYDQPQQTIPFSADSTTRVEVPLAPKSP